MDEPPERLLAVVMAGDGVAHQQVAEGGDGHADQPAPGHHGVGEEHAGGAQGQAPLQVHRRVHKDHVGHGEHIGDTVVHDHPVDWGLLLLPDGEGGLGVAGEGDHHHDGVLH